MGGGGRACALRAKPRVAAAPRLPLRRAVAAAAPRIASAAHGLLTGDSPETGRRDVDILHVDALEPLLRNAAAGLLQSQLEHLVPIRHVHACVVEDGDVFPRLSVPKLVRAARIFMRAGQDLRGGGGAGASQECGGLARNGGRLRRRSHPEVRGEAVRVQRTDEADQQQK